MAETQRDPDLHPAALRFRWMCLAMGSRAAYSRTCYGIRIGEWPAALLREARFRPTTRAAARWPVDHRPQFRDVARTPGGGQAGDRCGAPGPRAYRRH